MSEGYRNFPAFSRTCSWKIRIESPEKNDFFENRLQNDREFTCLNFYTTRRESMITLHCTLQRRWTWPEEVIDITFSVINNRNQIFKTVSCEIFKDEDFLSLGRQDFETIEEFVEHKDLLFGPNGNSCEILCEITVFRDESERRKINKSDDGNKQIKPVSANRLEKCYESKKFCDVKLVAADGQAVEAHKFILAAHSPVFSAMFEHEMKESKENLVEIDDIDSEVLQNFVLCLYSGLLGNQKLSQSARDILPVAEKYGVEDLKQECEVALVQQLTIKNSFGIFLLADKYNAEYLKKETKEFMINRIGLVVKTEDFKKEAETQTEASLKELITSLAGR